MSTIVDRLRNETRALHDRIERAVPILRPGAGERVYRAHLARLLGYYRPVEADLMRVPGVEDLGLDLDARRKVPKLERDLAALGFTREQIAKLPLCLNTPRIDSTGAVFGVCYVLEGATLGGKVVHRELTTRMPAVARDACSFLRPYGEDTGPRWTSFLSSLVAHAKDEVVQAQVLRAARETFSTMEAWIDG